MAKNEQVREERMNERVSECMPPPRAPQVQLGLGIRAEERLCGLNLGLLPMVTPGENVPCSGLWLGRSDTQSGGQGTNRKSLAAFGHFLPNKALGVGICVLEAGSSTMCSPRLGWWLTVLLLAF